MFVNGWFKQQLFANTIFSVDRFSPHVIASKYSWWWFWVAKLILPLRYLLGPYPRGWVFGKFLIFQKFGNFDLTYLTRYTTPTTELTSALKLLVLWPGWDSNWVKYLSVSPILWLDGPLHHTFDKHQLGLPRIRSWFVGTYISYCRRTTVDTFIRADFRGIGCAYVRFMLSRLIMVAEHHFS